MRAIWDHGTVLALGAEDEGAEDAASRSLAEGGLRCGVGGRADVHSHATETRSLRADIRPAHPVTVPPRRTTTASPGRRWPTPRRSSMTRVIVALRARRGHGSSRARVDGLRLTAPDRRRRSTSSSPTSPHRSERSSRRHGHDHDPGAHRPPAFENSPATWTLRPSRAATQRARTSSDELGQTPRGRRRPGHCEGSALVVAARGGTPGGRSGDRDGRADVHSQRPGFRSLRADIRPAPHATAQSALGKHTRSPHPRHLHPQHPRTLSTLRAKEPHA